MPFHIRDPETDSAVRELGRLYDAGPTETVKRAVRAELDRRAAESTMVEKIRALQAKIALRPSSGLKADKAFYDSLNGEGDE